MKIYNKKICFAKTHPNATIPTKERENAGYDLYACFDDNYIVIPSFSTVLIPTGIAWAASDRYYMQIEERSSTGVKGIKRSAGVIDSGYRGEIKIAIYNANKFDMYISKIPRNHMLDNKMAKNTDIIYPYTKAIAQGIIHNVPKMKVEVIDYNLLKTISSTRKDGGFGSSKK